MKRKNPLVSFITPMKEKDFRVIPMLKSIRDQNYPQNRIEIIIIDGGSNPKVLEECKKYNVKIYNNPKKLAEGAGMGKDQGIWKAKGEFVVISESDIEFMDKDWVNNMLKPLLDDEKIFASVPKLYVNKKDSLTNRYLSYLGVDPFAIYRAFDAQIEINPKLKKIKKEGYFAIKIDKERPFCMGSNGFMFRKDLTKKVGDYAQDVEFIARLAKNGFLDFAFVPNASVWHKNVKSLMDFIKKRIKWTRNYSKIYIKEKKDFNWITNRNEFLFYVAKNLLFFPQIPLSVSKTIEYRDASWLLHAPLLFFSTILNIYCALTSRQMLKQVF